MRLGQTALKDVGLILLMRLILTPLTTTVRTFLEYYVTKWRTDLTEWMCILVGFCTSHNCDLEHGSNLVTRVHWSQLICLTHNRHRPNVVSLIRPWQNKNSLTRPSSHAIRPVHGKRVQVDIWWTVYLCIHTVWSRLTLFHISDIRD